MAKYSKQKSNQKASPETIEAANSIAQGTQKIGQTKEQTKLVAQGIQKGIEQFKKQQKLKAKQQEKNHKKRNRDISSASMEKPTTTEFKQHWLPWFLLVLSWVVWILYWLVTQYSII